MQSAFVSILSLMAVSVLLVWIFRRLALPPVLAYLVAGVISGPEILQLFTSADDIHLAAEIGIVFLLFTLGLEFSLARVLAMRRLVFGLGSVQMLLSTIVIAAIAYALGQNFTASFIIGASIGLSSTAIVIKTLEEQGKLNTQGSQIAISVLLFQDLAVVPLLIVVPLLNSTSDTNILSAIMFALLKGIVVVLVLLAAGKWVLPRLFNEIAKTKTDELFVLSTILVTLLASGFTYVFGLSMALGAFLAGMMLSESQYRHQLEADIRPFRDILMGLFFVSVGMKLELVVFVNYLHYILLGLILVILIKAILVRVSALIVNEHGQDGWAAGFKLAQLGEFSFVIIALAFENTLISSKQSSILVSIGLLSMATTPWLISHSTKFAKVIMANSKTKELNQANEAKKDDASDHIIILGFGRVGQSLAKMLKLEALEFQAIDSDPLRVQEARAAGEQVIFGEVAKKQILLKANAQKAKSAVITFDEHEKALKVISALKSINPNIIVLVRTRKDYLMQDLFDAGAEQVVPEVQEGSLMLISQVLHYSGVTMSRILKRVRTERKQGYEHMHGFFPGETTEITHETSDKLEFLHAIAMSENAFAVGKTLAQLDLSRKRVKLMAIRRLGKEQETPPLDTVVSNIDVLIVSGKPRRIEKIEAYLLKGA